MSRAISSKAGLVSGTHIFSKVVSYGDEPVAFPSCWPLPESLPDLQRACELYQVEVDFVPTPR